MTPQNLQDLYLHQLRDLYSAESQLVDALPKLADRVSNTRLRIAVNDLLEEAKRQKARLEIIFERLNAEPTGQTFHEMKGLIREVDDVIDDATSLFGKDAPPEVLDAGLVTAAQRVEHYEISGMAVRLHTPSCLTVRKTSAS